MSERGTKKNKTWGKQNFEWEQKKTPNNNKTDVESTSSHDLKRRKHKNFSFVVSKWTQNQKNKTCHVLDSFQTQKIKITTKNNLRHRIDLIEKKKKILQYFFPSVWKIVKTSFSFLETISHKTEANV